MSNHDFEKLENRLRQDLETRPSARVLQRLEKKAAWRASPWQSLSRLFLRLAIVGLLIVLAVLPLMQENPRSGSQPDSGTSQSHSAKRPVDGSQTGESAAPDLPDSEDLLALCGAGSHFAWRNQAEFSDTLFDENCDRSANLRL